MRFSGIGGVKDPSVPADMACGRISGEYVYCYPPGIPLLLPGERVSMERLRQIRALQDWGASVRHGSGPGERDTFLVIDEECESGLTNVHGPMYYKE